MSNEIKKKKKKKKNNSNHRWTLISTKLSHASQSIKRRERHQQGDYSHRSILRQSCKWFPSNVATWVHSLRLTWHGKRHTRFSVDETARNLLVRAPELFPLEVAFFEPCTACGKLDTCSSTNTIERPVGCKQKKRLFSSLCQQTTHTYTFATN
jgi:hypothetical protein